MSECLVNLDAFQIYDINGNSESPRYRALIPALKEVLLIFIT